MTALLVKVARQIVSANKANSPFWEKMSGSLNSMTPARDTLAFTIRLTMRLILVLFLFFQLFYAQQCDFAGCASCTTASGGICGYCPATQSCLAGNASGPAGSVCHGWIFGSGACPDCSIYSSCVECTDEEACGWSNSTNACINVDAAGASKVCPCKSYDQCTDCRRALVCGWCPDTSTCEVISPRVDAAAAAGTTCKQYASNCTCAPHASCGRCTAQADICGWCSKTSTCQSLSTTGGCKLTQTCSGGGRSFSGGSFVGGLFLGMCTNDDYVCCTKQLRRYWVDPTCGCGVFCLEKILSPWFL